MRAPPSSHEKQIKALALDGTRTWNHHHHHRLDRVLPGGSPDASSSALCARAWRSSRSAGCAFPPNAPPLACRKGVVKSLVSIKVCSERKKVDSVITLKEKITNEWNVFVTFYNSNHDMAYTMIFFYENLVLYSHINKSMEHCGVIFVCPSETDPKENG